MPYDRYNILVFDPDGRRVPQTGFHDDTRDSTGICDFGYNIFGEQTLEHTSSTAGCRHEIYANGRHLAITDQFNAANTQT
ncbi:MAG TPA: hypothetical protein VLV88_16550, partial [Terriglobales bacterium]|nr:hypothetical protein [Terriglobales bacterium]